jgi:hypothetical protein
MQAVHARGAATKVPDKPQLDLTAKIRQSFLAFLSALGEGEPEQIPQARERGPQGRCEGRRKSKLNGRTWRRQPLPPGALPSAIAWPVGLDSIDHRGQLRFLRRALEPASGVCSIPQRTPHTPPALTPCGESQRWYTWPRPLIFASRFSGF